MCVNEFDLKNIYKLIMCDEVDLKYVRKEIQNSCHIIVSSSLLYSLETIITLVRIISCILLHISSFL